MTSARRFTSRFTRSSGFVLTIWFNPAMMWEAAPAGKRGRQPAHGDAAVTRA